MIKSRVVYRPWDAYPYHIEIQQEIDTWRFLSARADLATAEQVARDYVKGESIVAEFTSADESPPATAAAPP